MTERKITDLERCMIAIHDHGTRDGATAQTVVESLKVDGFKESTIKDAVSKMSGNRGL